MKNKGCVPNVVSFNTLIKGFFREGKVEEAVGMVHEMTELGCEFSGVTCEILAFKLMEKMLKDCIVPDSVTFNWQILTKPLLELEKDIDSSNPTQSMEDKSS
ncbi:unnamed protein product [Fraxinus pennsylvanica]|uniref:Pentatricopeptide repeat-containing protein n=1 Tax=Fraxinus pennsylvanica TaxID=56036 RepID=A0AAD2E4W2_9LAMI|nr:unnamed protein product [Fraxinus pennsylvanica]